MNNKQSTKFATAPSYDLNNNNLLITSKIDELIFFCNDVDATILNNAIDEVTEAIIDANYLPEGLADFSTHILTAPINVRQDIKKRKAIRLSQATVGQGLFILSSTDSFEQYFMNSVVIKTGSGYIRFGVCNFTANQANNPFAPSQQSVLNALWSFFDIDSTMLLLSQ